MNGKLFFAFLLTIATLFSKTLANPVATNFQTLVPSSSGPIQGLNSCLIPCPKNGKNPVCGSDGVTYTSPEELSCYAACRNNLTQKHTGNCTKKPAARKHIMLTSQNL